MTANQEKDEISLRELFLKIRNIWFYLLSKWKIILLAGFFGGLLGIVYAIYKKPTYKAVISFVLDEQRVGGGGMGAYAGIASQFGINMGGIEGQGLFSGDNIMEFFRSRRMVQKTLLTYVDFNGEKELLIDRYANFTHLREMWDKKEELKKLSFKPDIKDTYLRDSVLKEVYKTFIEEYLTVDKLDKKLNIITVEVETIDEQFSKAFVEQLVKNVSEDYVGTVTMKSSENLKVLTKMVDSVRRELNEAIGGVAVSVQANPNANPALQSLLVPSQRRSVDVQANTAIFSELVRQQELARMTLRNERPLIQILDQPVLPLDKTKVGKVKGAIIGGVLFGFLSVCILLVRLAFQFIMKESVN